MATEEQIKNLINGFNKLKLNGDQANERIDRMEKREEKRKKPYKIGKPEPFTGDPAKLQGFLTRMDMELDYWGLTQEPEEEKVKFVGTYIQGDAGK
jgi:hypothetical protein